MGEQPLSESIRTLLPRLRGKRGDPAFISAENLAFALRDQLGRPLSTSYIQQIEWGKTPASRDVLEAIAAHFNVDANVFLEYRLERIRRLFDERDVGLDAAAANLEMLLSELPVALSVSERLDEGDEDQARRVAQALAEARRRLLLEDETGPADRSDEAAPPPAATSAPGSAPRRQRRRPA